jgi:signal transduction histidine kinase
MKAETAATFSGIALRCKTDGIIQEVISDSLGAESCLQKGESFIKLFDTASHSKAESFLEKLNENKAAFGWEMNIACQNGKIETVHFAGAADEKDDLLFIVGAKTRKNISKFYNDLIRINNEQTNALRSTMKDLSVQMREQNERDNHLYDELSRLNNELATTQRELSKKNIELAHLNQEKNQFLGIASHDLRNPLSVIQTYSEFLLEDADKFSEEQVEFIRKIYSSSAFMLNLVNDFLDFSKIEAGRLEVSPAKINLNQFIRRIFEQNRLLADKKQIQIKLNLFEKLPEVVWDETKIEQILNNLISNAVKFSDIGGKIEISAKAGENAILLSVEDNGAGIALEKAEKIFSPFVKGNKGTAGEKSVGLGLAIVKKIVEAHGGNISLETELGKGTVFYVLLPLDIKKKSAEKNIKNEYE